ncbi:MAG: cysteine sulfinate desulfinase [Candidatus Muproteobacteria bacterium RBG_16_64_11]|uniref:Cysteine desulfurase n=1 Tax=Candidatus Muproteobacteria bacterium RBG_16_64_11 TaxID=1817758 RepID=A0A1F6TAU1_9PROT|nr:MAG: cysteine sulfinate desulfinase [Candidatus Muproteobacteria bacterium RBG_16_64_11]
MLDVARLRADFPVLGRRINGKPLAYLDSAASAQMPLAAIERMRRYQMEEHANVHRGVHSLSEIATAAYEDARRKVRLFLGAREDREIVFVRGATEAINLVMHGYGRAFLGAGDEIVISALEHHSNIVPWQMLCREKGATLRVIPMNDAGELLLDEYEKLFNARTKFVALAHVSNALGTVNPIADMIRTAHRHGVPILIDGAQAAPHLQVDVQELDCDFYAFSGHKVYGPTGIGALYGKAALLEKMQPYQGGGDMILNVSFEHTDYNEIPFKFEAGTPAIAAAIGLGAALDYVTAVGLPRIAAHEHQLLSYATELLTAIPEVRLIGTARAKAGVISFEVGDVHPHDVGTLLNDEGIAIRAGHHCAQPVMQCYGVAATARASFGLYNTLAEVDALAAGIHKVKKVFG